MYEFWSKWPPKMTLEVVPLKCASRQQKALLLVPVSAMFSSQMQLEVGRKRSTTTTIKIMSGRDWRELRPCRYPFSLREAAAQFTASHETASKIWREFRPCQRLFFVHRSQSTQQTKNHSKKIGENSVHADDCFSQCIGRTEHSRATGL